MGCSSNTAAPVETSLSSVTGSHGPAHPTSMSSANDSKTSDSTATLRSAFTRKTYPAVFITKFDPADFLAVTDLVAEQPTSDGFYYWCQFEKRDPGFVTYELLDENSQRDMLDITAGGLRVFKSYVKNMSKYLPNLF